MVVLQIILSEQYFETDINNWYADYCSLCQSEIYLMSSHENIFLHNSRKVRVVFTSVTNCIGWGAPSDNFSWACLKPPAFLKSIFPNVDSHPHIPSSYMPSPHLPIFHLQIFLHLISPSPGQDLLCLQSHKLHLAPPFASNRKHMKTHT